MSVSRARRPPAGPLATAGALLLATSLITASPILASSPKPTASISTVAAPQSPTSTIPTSPKSAAPAAVPPADLVLIGGKIYTVDPSRSRATALAVKDSKIVFIGSAADAQRWIGPKTQTEQLGGRCVDVRTHPEKYASDAAVAEFMRIYGHHPAQCQISSGQLQHSREVILEYIKRMHLAGFNVHIHAISNRSVRTAVDAIEAARAADGVSTTHDSLAHLQLVDPSDVERIGRDHLYIAFTYAWMDTDTDYDITTVPFFEKVGGNSSAALHRPGSYFESNTYPVKAVKTAGGILAAGSDAPVETRDPRPFINMTRAITRSISGNPPLSPQQSITIRDVIEAYTINGARMLSRDRDTGSLEVGKSADFIVVDRDILSLADGGHPEGIADTRVLSTWFRGKKVYGADKI